MFHNSTDSLISSQQCCPVCNRHSILFASSTLSICANDQVCQHVKLHSGFKKKCLSGEKSGTMSDWSVKTRFNQLKFLVVCMGSGMNFCLCIPNKLEGVVPSHSWLGHMPSQMLCCRCFVLPNYFKYLLVAAGDLIFPVRDLRA